MSLSKVHHTRCIFEFGQSYTFRYNNPGTAARRSYKPSDDLGLEYSDWPVLKPTDLLPKKKTYPYYYGIRDTVSRTKYSQRRDGPDKVDGQGIHD